MQCYCSDKQSTVKGKNRKFQYHFFTVQASTAILCYIPYENELTISELSTDSIYRVSPVNVFKDDW